MIRRLERRACGACGTFAAECEVPRGDAAIACCWQCAHAVIAHDVDAENLRDAILGGSAEMLACSCPVDAIYPADVVAQMGRAQRWIPPGAFPVAAVPEPDAAARPSRGVAISLGMRAARRARLIRAALSSTED